MDNVSNVKGSWQTPEFLCISIPPGPFQPLFCKYECSLWTRVFRDGNTGGGREREAKTVMPQCASGDRHHVLCIHTWSCNCELLQGSGVNHDSVRVGLEQAQGELSGKQSLCWDGQRTDINWGWWSRRQKNPIGKRNAQRPWGRCLDSAAK